ncbi:hypothetical protein [Planctomyces sp. SH-PL14]|nr:hypothetical protein [Planctomyces sp. SH-PL14]
MSVWIFGHFLYPPPFAFNVATQHGGLPSGVIDDFIPFDERPPRDDPAD